MGFCEDVSKLVDDLGEGSLVSEFCVGDDWLSTPEPSSTGRRTSELDSSCCHVKQEKENSGNNQGNEEEEKEQCSPVSVLYPLFDEDDERESTRDNEEDEDEDEEDFDMECNYTNLQRAKQQLMQRLRRFEKLNWTLLSSRRSCC